VQTDVEPVPRRRRAHRRLERHPDTAPVFRGSRRVIDRRPDRDQHIDIYIAGAQHHDRSVSHDIVVHELHAEHPLTITQARQLAAALTAAADEAEQMGDYDQIAV
jgi:truncated hemoglobin YjbI